MKFKLLLLPALFLLLTVNGQTSNNKFLVANPESSSSGTISPDAKALKNFRRSFPSVSNESWRTENGYYIATFRQGEVKNKIVYKRDGRVDYALKMYTENYLPSSVRSLVKSVYYDFAITNVQELELKNNTIFLVKVSDAKSWKTLRISNGEMEEIDTIAKRD